MDEAVGAMSELGDDAKVISGGQSLVPLLNMRVVRPSALVDISRIPELGELEIGEQGLTIGAAVTQLGCERSDELASRMPVFREVLRHVGHVPIRARGTICGSVAHADAAAEMPALMLALDATMAVSGKSGSRTVGASDFFKSFFTTALKADEVLVRIVVSAGMKDWGAAFTQLARRHGDFAIASVVAFVDVGGDGRVRAARVALSGVADVPVRAETAESVLVGADADDQAAVDRAVDDAKEAVRAAIDPPGDIHATSHYRREIAGVLAARALRIALDRAVGAAA